MEEPEVAEALLRHSHRYSEREAQIRFYDILGQETLLHYRPLLRLGKNLSLILKRNPRNQGSQSIFVLTGHHIQ